MEMRAMIKLTLILVLFATPVAAEDNPIRWPSHRPIADWVSTGLVATNVTADVVTAWRAEDRKQAFKGLACRNAIAVGSSELIKLLVHRERPDGSDNKSFWSEHSAWSAATARWPKKQGWSVGIGYTIAGGTGYLRGAADRHYLSDIGVGFGVGFIADKVCAEWIP